MFLTYRYKLAPTRGQYRVLERVLEAQRQLYNAALQERRDAWSKQGLSISKLDQNKSLTRSGRSIRPMGSCRWPCLAGPSPASTTQ